MKWYLNLEIGSKQALASPAHSGREENPPVDNSGLGKM
jgi:hypothetical protein